MLIGGRNKQSTRNKKHTAISHQAPPTWLVITLLIVGRVLYQISTSFLLEENLVLRDPTPSVPADAGGSTAGGFLPDITKVVPVIKTQGGTQDLSLSKLRSLLDPGQEEQQFDRSCLLYVDFGLSDAVDTGLHLSRGYSIALVDAFLPWVENAKQKFAREIKDEHRLLVFNIGVSTEEADPMPLFFKQEGSVIASFDPKKGCQGVRSDSPGCKHRNVEMVRCEAIIILLNKAPELMKVDIEMLHHSCVRGLHCLPTPLLPQHVCWEEHEKPFGTDGMLRPVTDVKLVHGMHELGYDEVKVVMQGYTKVSNYYGLRADQEGGHGQGSGSLTVDEMMHYRSHERTEDGSFNTKWLKVNEVLKEGMFAPARDKPKHFFAAATYFDICMRLSPHAREDRAKPENFPLSSNASK